MNALKLTLFGCLLYSMCLTVTVAKKKGKLEKVEIVTEFMPEDCSRKAGSGDAVEVHYTGTLEDGTVFDSSRDEGREPISFQLGSGRVIKGWEEGIVGMCVGEKRKLTIPPHLGYGDKGAGPIPGGATLEFQVELMRTVSLAEMGLDESEELPAEAQPVKTPKPIDYRFIAKLIAIPSIILYVIYKLGAKMLKEPEDPKAKKESQKKGQKKQK